MCTTIDRNPGKFQSETCITKFAYFWMLNGDGDTQSDDDGTTEVLLAGPFDHDSVIEYAVENADHAVCTECYETLRAVKNILLRESSDGFVSSDTDVDAAGLWAEWERSAQASEDELIDFLLSV